jgi:hypothetical protein
MVRLRARGKIAWAGQGPHNAARTEGTPIVKLSLSSAWNEAKAVIASESRLLASVALAFFVLPGIVLWATVPETAPDELPPPGPWVAVLIAILLVSLVGQVAIARMAMPPHISVGEAVQRGLRRLLPFFLAFLLWVVPMVIIGAILYSFAALNPASSPGIALAALILLCALTVLALFMVVRRPDHGRLVDVEMYKARYGAPSNLEIAGSFTALARELGHHPAALAVAWVASHPAVTAPILGARSVAQLGPALGATAIAMTPELRDRISQLSPAPPPATDRTEEGIASLGER